MILPCAVCNQDKYGAHVSAAPHGSNPMAAPCAGYQPRWPCGSCGQDCELHDKDAPHAAPDFNCEGVQAPAGFEGGGGGYGGGGASGGW